jgi:hypothetical protein
MIVPVRGEFINPGARRWFNWKMREKVEKTKWIACEKPQAVVFRRVNTLEQRRFAWKGEAGKCKRGCFF